MSENRYLFIVNFVICVILSGVAFYFNYAQGIHLCPLCSLQLICYYLIGIISLIAFVHIPEKIGRYIYAILLLILTLFGILFSTRQIWLQQTAQTRNLPCAPNLLQLLSHSSLSHTWQVLFHSRGECTLMDWHFIGFSMAAWSLFFFIILTISGVILLFHAHREPQGD